MSQKLSVPSDRPKTTISFHPAIIQFIEEGKVNITGLCEVVSSAEEGKKKKLPSEGSLKNACKAAGVSWGVFKELCNAVNAAMRSQYTYSEMANPDDVSRIPFLNRNQLALFALCGENQQGIKMGPNAQPTNGNARKSVDPPRSCERTTVHSESPFALYSNDDSRVILVKPYEGEVPEAALISAVQMDATGEDMHFAIAHQEFELASPTTGTPSLPFWFVLLKRIPLVWKATITVAAVSIVALSMAVFIAHMGRSSAHAQFKANLTKIKHATDASFGPSHSLEPFSIVKDAILHPFSMTPDARRLAMLQQQDASLGHLVYYSDEPQAVATGFKQIVADYAGGKAIVFVYLIDSHQNVIAGSNSIETISMINMDIDVAASPNYRLIAAVFPLDETQDDRGSLKLTGVHKP